MPRVESFYIKPNAGEVLQTTITLQTSPPPALLGTVLSHNQKPLTGALVALYHANEDAPDVPITACYTDAQGQFALGNLQAGRLYHVRIVQDTTDLRIVEQSHG